MHQPRADPLRSAPCDASSGLPRPPPSGSRATSVAVDPARGRSWIGASIGSGEVGAVLAPLDLCTAVESAGAARLVRVAAGLAGGAPTTLPAATSQPVKGSIAGVTSLGGAGCGALLLRAGKAARVLQAGDAGDSPSVVQLPANLRAGVVYRCRRHVMVVGARRSNGLERASVAVVPIARR